jgi:hypothetical protein
LAAHGSLTFAFMKFFLMTPLQTTTSPTTFAAFPDDKREKSIWGRESLAASGVVQIILATKGRKWMDFIPGRDVLSPLLCSDRVVRTLVEGEFTGFKALPTILYLNNGKIFDPPCPYFWLVPTGLPFRLKYRWYSGTRKNCYQKMVLESDCERDIQILSRKTGENYYQLMVPDQQTWDGSDFNQFTEYEPVSTMGSYRCSRRVVELAAKEKWTNVQFFSSGRVSVPHLKDSWCPKGFYDNSD